MSKFDKPWGSYESLAADPCFHVKKIIVSPGRQPSYQYHFNRNEHWIIISGTGIVTIDGEESDVSEGSAVYVRKESKHRIKNTGSEDLVFVEVQTGTYFGEDDIVRVEDDYGRV